MGLVKEKFTPCVAVALGGPMRSQLLIQFYLTLFGALMSAYNATQH